MLRLRRGDIFDLLYLPLIRALRVSPTLPLIEPIFERTFIAIFYVPVSVLTMRKYISLTIRCSTIRRSGPFFSILPL